MLYFTSPQTIIGALHVLHTTQWYAQHRSRAGAKAGHRVTLETQEMGKCTCTCNIALLHVWLVLGSRLHIHIALDSTDALAA